MNEYDITRRNAQKYKIYYCGNVRFLVTVYEIALGK
jgi:hypothetical protein